MNRLKQGIVGLLMGWYAVSSFAQMPFHLENGSGSIRFGVVCGKESRWLDECKVHTSGETITVNDAVLKGGAITLTVRSLTDTQGLIIEITGQNLPEEVQLCQAFGGCDNQALAKTDSEIPPAACHYNVFSTEGNAFSVYYGESMALRITQGVTPVGAMFRLCDARQQRTPTALYESGKKTDAPVIASLFPIKSNEKLYFCFYKQRAKADYNYFMLPEVFQKTPITQ